MQAQLDADSQQQAQREQELAAAVANKEDALEQLTSQVGGRGGKGCDVASEWSGVC